MIRYELSTTALPSPSRHLTKAVGSILALSIRDSELLFNIDLALTETCANVVRHAYEGREPGELRIVLRLEPPKCVHIEVLDWGKGLPEGPLKCENPEPEAEGGRGLFIMSQLSDIFEARKDGSANVIALTINTGDDAWIPYE